MIVPARALRLAARGIPSFPVLENKAPACPLGFKAATCDVDGMKALWGRWPGPLVGVVTGAASGFDVLDIDPRHGGDAWLSAHLDRLPTTRLHITRSGRPAPAVSACRWCPQHGEPYCAGCRHAG